MDAGTNFTTHRNTVDPSVDKHFDASENLMGRHTSIDSVSNWASGNENIDMFHDYLTHEADSKQLRTSLLKRDMIN